MTCKPGYVLLLGILFMLLAASPAVAQQAAGTVHGEVTDAETGESLPGANIIVEGTGLGAATDANGRYTIRGVPTGTHTLVFTYIGFEQQDREIAVRSGTNPAEDAQMEAASLEAGEVVVTAMRRGRARALNQQRNAKTIKNIVSSEQIQSYPDVSVADALQRMPGMTRVRGLGVGGEVVTVDGQRMASTGQDGRGTTVGGLSTDLVESIEVSKAFTPDMPGDATGGAVEITTRRPVGTRRIFEVRAGGGANLQNQHSAMGVVNQPNYRGSVTYGQRTPVFSYVLNASHRSDQNYREQSRRNWGAQEFGNGPELVLGRFRTSLYPYDDDRYGASVNLDYYPSETTAFFLRSSYSLQDQRRETYQVRYRLDNGIYDTPTSTSGERGSITSESRRNDNSYQQFNVSAGGEHALSFADLDYSVGFAHGRWWRDRDIVRFEAGEGFDFRYDITDRRFPTLEITGEDAANSEVYQLDRLDRRGQESTDNTVTASVDLDAPFQAGGVQGSFQMGGQFDTKSKVADQWMNRHEVEEVVNVGSFATKGYRVLGRYDIPFAIDWKKDTTLDEYIAQGVFIPMRDYNAEASNQYDYEARESIAAGYAMSTLELGDLTILGGLRLEQTFMDYEAKEILLDEEGAFAGTEPARNDRSYLDLFPALHVRYALGPQTNVRTALTRTIARPGFRDLSPYRRESIESETIDRGNPDLTPMRSTNADLLVEHYFQNVGILSGGVFYKHLRDFVFTEERTLTSGEFAGWQEYRPVNGDESTVYGVEIAWEQSMGFLPGVLSGLGIYSNYTYTGSRADYGREEKLMMEGVQPHTVNVALSYKHRGFSGQVAYWWRSRYLGGVGSGLPDAILQKEGFFGDYYRAGYQTIDVSLRQDIGGSWQAFLNVDDLLGAHNWNYYGSEDYQRYDYNNAWSVDIGVRYSL